MSKATWATVGIAATIASMVIALHGITSRRWQTFHTVAVLAGLAAYVAPKAKLVR